MTKLSPIKKETSSEELSLVPSVAENTKIVNEPEFDIEAIKRGGYAALPKEAQDYVMAMTTHMDDVPVDLIALDVEGFEYKALLGAKETIEKFHPVIIAENADTDEFRKLLVGYNLVDKSVRDSIWVHQNSS